MTAESSSAIPFVAPPLEIVASPEPEPDSSAGHAGAVALTGAMPPGPEAGEPPADEMSILVRQVVSGDEQAAVRLFNTLKPMVTGYCRARLGWHETGLGSAEDVAQEAIIGVIKALQTYKPGSDSFRSFVYAIAAHKVLDAYRAAGRNRTDAREDIPDFASGEAGPDRNILDLELSAALNGLMTAANLSQRQRDVVVRRVAFGFTVQETAEIVGSSPTSVRVTQHRALNKLRRALAERAAAASAKAETEAGSSAGDSSVEE